jgi:hypothetical protein
MKDQFWIARDRTGEAWLYSTERPTYTGEVWQTGDGIECEMMFLHDPPKNIQPGECKKVRITFEVID